MKILTTQGFAGYQLLDTGGGYRLEQVGGFKLARPDPQIIWDRHLPPKNWESVDAIFDKEGGSDAGWKVKTKLPPRWEMTYGEIKFFAKLSPFKHLGFFPEQHLHWDWIKEKINASNGQPKILNLFAYTGLASLVCARAGASVTHVDASRPTIGWARENQVLSGLGDAPIRWILDDVSKFVTREIKRGNRYDGIILDPPAYGHGPTGQTWKFHVDVPRLLEMCKRLLSDKPLFIIMNAYAISSSALMLENLFIQNFAKLGGTIESGELVIQEQSARRLLSTGLFARWS